MTTLPRPARLPSFLLIAPIALSVACSSGGGGGSAASITGRLVLAATSPATWDEGPGRTGTIGFAREAGVLAAATPRVAGGESGLSLRSWTVGPTQVRLTELLVEGIDNRLAATPTAGHQWRAAALRARELVLLEAPVAGGPQRLRVLSRRAARPARELELGLAAPVRGMAAALDLLFLLHDGNTGSTLTALDLENGTTVAEIDLDAPPLDRLAGGRELATGDVRMFSFRPASAEIVELEVRRQATSWSIDAGARSFPWHAGVADLAYDGALLHVLDEHGARHAVDPDSGATIAVAAGLVPGAVALCAELDLGLDGRHFRVAGDAPASVRLWTGATETYGGADLFVMAIDRARALRNDPSAVLFFDRTDPGGATPVRELWPRSTSSVDIVVGALRAGARYQLLAGGAPGTPQLASSRRARTDATARGIARHLDERVMPRLDAERVRALYLDFTLPQHVPGRLALAPVPEDFACPPDVAGEFRLNERHSSPSGYRAVEYACAGGWLPSPLEALHGRRIPGAERSERCRELLALIDALSGRSDVRWCEPFLHAWALRVPDDPGYERQRWAHEQIRLPEAWDVQTGVPGTIVGVVDSGIRYENLDLVGVYGHDLIRSSDDAGDGDGIDPDPFDPGFRSHGTHVAGSAVARGNNGNGGTGVLWRGRVMPVRAIGIDGSGLQTDIAEAVRYAAGLPNASGAVPPEAADVINMSLGAPDSSSALRNAVQAALDRGIPVVVAAGNIPSGEPAGISFPASMAGTIAVGATNASGNRAPYSETGPELDVMCPGGALVNRIWSTIGEGSDPPQAGYWYGWSFGTSMACGIASGVVGLVVSHNAALSPAEVKTLLRTTAVDIGAPGVDDQTGAGLVDAAAALDGSRPVLALSASTLDYGDLGSALLVQAFNAGAGQLTITGVNITPEVGPDADWLTASILQDGITIALAADRSALPDGTYQARASVVTNGGSADVVLSLTQDAAATPVDVGAVLLELRDPNGAVVASQSTSLASDYTYTIGGVGNGSYFLVAGTDVDGDGVLCEAEELCTAYPTASSPGVLAVTRAQTFPLDLLLDAGSIAP